MYPKNTIIGQRGFYPSGLLSYLTDGRLDFTGPSGWQQYLTALFGGVADCQSGLTGHIIGDNQIQESGGMITFTDEELAELTPYNAAAYNWFRMKTQGEGKQLPCWLCLSDRAKCEAQVGLANWLTRELKPAIPFTVEEAQAYIEKNMVQTLEPKVNLWKKAELAMKKQREGGNPRAFFASR